LHGWGPEGLDTLRLLAGEVGSLFSEGSWQSARVDQI